MEDKFHALTVLIKEWELLDLKPTRTLTNINVKYDNLTGEWYVEVLGEETVGYTVEEALTKQINRLSTDNEYLEAKNIAFINEVGVENEFIKRWPYGV